MEHKKIECEECHKLFTVQNIKKHRLCHSGVHIFYKTKGKSKTRVRKTCEKCGLAVTVQNYQKHFNACKGIKKLKYVNFLRNEEGELYCKYCKTTGFENVASLKNHLSSCEVFQNLPKDSLGRVKTIASLALTDEGNHVCKFCGRVLKVSYALTAHEKYCKKNPNRVEGNFSHPCSDENRLHQAMLARQRLEKFGQFVSFNKEACEFINKLNEEKNWNLQHAMNGGEYQVGPYYLDGYDKDKNIVFEYNEPAHYASPERILRDRKRAEFIHQKLNCQFFVYNEKEDNLEQWY